VEEERKRWQRMLHEVCEGLQAAGRRLQAAGCQWESVRPFRLLRQVRTTLGHECVLRSPLYIRLGDDARKELVRTGTGHSLRHVCSHVFLVVLVH